MIFANKNFLLSNLMKASMLMLLLIEFYSGKMVVAIMICAMIFVSFLPWMLAKNTKKNVPWTLDFMVTGALFLHTIGVVFGFYKNFEDFWWWDKMTHFFGTFVVGVMAFYLVFMVQFLGRVVMSVPMTGFFVFMVAMGVGAIWEILEFWNDRLLGTETQISLSETMVDLQMDMLGAILIAFVGMRFMFVKRAELDEFEKSRKLKEEIKLQKRKKNKRKKE